MSTTNPTVEIETTPEIESPTGPDVDAGQLEHTPTPEPVALPTLECPRDGTILGGMHQVEPGWYECPQCQTRRPIWEVFRDE